MSTAVNYITLFLCFVMLVLYYKFSSYRSKYSILLFIIGILLLYTKLSSLGIAEIFIYNSDTLFSSFILLIIPFVCLLIQYRKDLYRIRMRIGYFFKFITLYLFFGALQQIFFLLVFTHTILSITNNPFISFLAGSIFYFLFHLRKNSELKKFLPYVLIFGVLMNFIYIYLGNIVPQMILHGIFGAIGFTLITDNDIVKKSLK